MVLSPFRKSVNLERDYEITTKKKRHSLRIITGADSQQTIITSPSSVRQKLSSFFRSSSPVVTSLKETFSANNSNLSHDNLHGNNRHLSFSTVSFVSVGEHPQENTPTLMQSLANNNSITTLSSSSEASDHMPASPADGAGTTAAKNTFWQPAPTMNNSMMSLSCHAPAPPPHQQQSLSLQVYQILGSTLDEVDDEIEQDWEHSRNQLRQSLVLPQTCERIY